MSSRIRQRSPRGVALLLAILIVALIAAAAGEFLYRSRVDINAAGNFRDREQARYAAVAGIESGLLFITSLKENQWADALVSLGVPPFGTGGFILGDDKESITRPQQELEGQFFNDESNLTDIDFAMDYSGLERKDPQGFNNGYLLFIASMTGFNLFDDDDIDVQIRFIDESSRFNLNALYYCSGGSGCAGEGGYNRLLYFQIRQLLIEQLIREPERREREPGDAFEENIEEDTSERARQAGFSLRDQEQRELTDSDVDGIMCAILDWLDPDSIEANNEGCQAGAEQDYYNRLDEPYPPRNGPMESPGELRLIKGITPEIYRAIEPYVTVYPQVTQGDCTALLADTGRTAPENLTLDCFDERVNLHAASDAVIRAWAVGGYQRGTETEPDLRTKDFPEFKEELLTLLNCARTPKQTSEDGQSTTNGSCPAPAPGTQTQGETPAGDCWASPADVKRVLEQSGIYTFAEVGNIPNVGAAGANPLSCSGGGRQGQQAAPLSPSQANFRTLVGDFVTIEAIGQVGLTRYDEEFADEESEASASGLIEYKITATYRVDSSKSPPVVTLLRWQEQ